MATLTSLIGCDSARRLRAIYGSCVGKRGYACRSEADTAVFTIRRWVRPGNAPVPARSYECACGKWHLTSTTDRHSRVAL